MGKRWAIVLVVAVLGLAAAGGISYAQDRPNAGGVSCGETITADTTLDSDLTDCPNNGIVIGADDITLDLNDHVIDGDGTPAAGCGPEDDCDLGLASIGHDGVTVVHGSVREFAIGVAVAGESGKARHNRVLDISSSKNDFFGIFFFAVAGSLVRNSSGNRNVPPDGDGMGLFGSRHIRILHNSIRRNGGPGIHVADSTHNLIKGNVFARSPDIPVFIEGSDHNRVRRNRLVRNNEGITVGGSRNVIARNRIFRGRSYGISIDKGRGNLVAHNLVARARGTGILLGLEHPLIGGGHNTVRRNLVRGSGDDGFLVSEKEGHSLLRRNRARNGDDGFDVQSRSTKLTRNGARRNTDLGIQAARGVIDGGGNRASGNGDARQCVNVRCH